MLEPKDRLRGCFSAPESAFRPSRRGAGTPETGALARQPLVERALFLEHLVVDRHANRSVENTGDAVQRELLDDRMWRGIGAEGAAAFIGGCSFAQRQAVAYGLDDRHDVEIGLDSPAEPVGAGVLCDRA